jgi:hypothetical protein
LEWRPFDDLISPGSSTEASEAIDGFATRLGVPVSRPVASLLHLAVCARFCFPLMATAAEFGVVPMLRPRQLRYTFDGSGRFRLAVCQLPGGVKGDPGALAEHVRDEVLSGHLGRLTRAINGLVALPVRTTDGNTASAVAAACRAVSAGSPEPTVRRAGHLLEWFLDHEPLEEAGTLVPLSNGVTGESRFQRRNCCLFFQVPGGGTCADCILGAPPKQGSRASQEP